MASPDQMSLFSVSTVSTNVSGNTVIDLHDDSHSNHVRTPSMTSSIGNLSTATLCSTANNSSSSSGQLQGMPDDVRKCGYMRKLKTNRRKYFVLRLNHFYDTNHATLSYYDNEKKFRANMDSSSQMPKRTTLLSACFAIHRKYDSKHKYVMAIYTREDMLATICDDETSLFDWLKACRAMMRQSVDFVPKPLRDLQYIWQVTINRTGLGLIRNITGLHRLCLAANVLYVIRVDPLMDNPDTYEFPLNSIRRCGHTTSTFFLELGRSSLIGQGDLWIQTEDQAMAQHMHEVVLAAMTHGNPGAAALSKDGESAQSTCTTASGSKAPHRPRSSSASNDNTKASVISLASSSTSIGRSNSGRQNAKQPPPQPSPQQQQSMPQGTGGNTPTSSTTSPQPQVTSPQQQVVAPPPHTNSMLPGEGGYGQHHFVHAIPGTPGHFYANHGHQHTLMHYGHTRGKGGAVQQSQQPQLPSPSQSPSASRERLHSGSWSRTTSECSNEDASSSGGGLCGSNSSSAGNTPVGPPSMYCTECHHLWSMQQPMPCACSYPAHSNFSLGCHSSTNGNNSSNSSMDCIDSMFEPHDFHSTVPTGGVLTLEPPISEEVDGCNSEEYYQMVMPPTNPSNGKSDSNNSISSMTSSKSLTNPCTHHHYVPHQVFCVHLPHLSHRSLRSNSMSNADRITGHTSPLISPKCYCSGCQNHYNNGGHFTLPTVPAGSDADYLPMAPLNASDGGGSTASDKGATTIEQPKPETYKENHQMLTNTEEDEREDDCYLDMAPLSPVPNKTSTTSSSSMSAMSGPTPSTSSEFHLEKVKSYFDVDKKTPLGASNSSTHQQHHANQPHQSSILQEDPFFNGLTRAYSTGSKPQPLQPSIAAQCTVAPKTVQSSIPSGTNEACSGSSVANNLRIRAFSTGSHGINFNALRLKKLQMKKQQAQQAAQTSSASFDAADQHMLSSSSSLAESETGSNGALGGHTKNNKASSAPILSPMIQQRTRAATIGARPSSLLTQQQQMHHMNQIHKLSYPHLGAHHHPALMNTYGYAPTAETFARKTDEDMMEIDYSQRRGHHRKAQTEMEESDAIVSSFDEEMREARKQAHANRTRQSSASGPSGSEAMIAALKSGGSTSLDGSTAAATTAGSKDSTSSVSIQPQARRRSDSTSAISNLSSLFASGRPSSSQQNHPTTSTTTSTCMQHHPLRNSTSTFDHLVQSFRHSLNLTQPSASTSPMQSVSCEKVNAPATTAMVVTPTLQAKQESIEQPEEYYMETGPALIAPLLDSTATPTCSKKLSNESFSTTTPTRSSSDLKSFASSLSSKIRKNKTSSSEKLKTTTPTTIQSALEQQQLPQQEQHSQFTSILSSTILPTPQPQPVKSQQSDVLTAKQQLELNSSDSDSMDVEALRKKIEVASHKGNDMDSDDDASIYVMMAPNGSSAATGATTATGSRKSTTFFAGTANAQKKQKTSAVRSFIFALGSSASKTQQHQQQPPAGAHPENQAADNSPRKKASTFSGRLGVRLNRSNSHHNQQQQQQHQGAISATTAATLAPGHDSKRKKNSKSESSTSIETNCSADHATPVVSAPTATPLAS